MKCGESTRVAARVAPAAIVAAREAVAVRVTVGSGVKVTVAVAVGVGVLEAVGVDVRVAVAVGPAAIWRSVGAAKIARTNAPSTQPRPAPSSTAKKYGRLESFGTFTKGDYSTKPAKRKTLKQFSPSAPPKKRTASQTSQERCRDTVFRCARRSKASRPGGGRRFRLRRAFP